MVWSLVFLVGFQRPPSWQAIPVWLISRSSFVAMFPYVSFVLGVFPVAVGGE